MYTHAPASILRLHLTFPTDVATFTRMALVRQYMTLTTKLLSRNHIKLYSRAKHSDETRPFHFLWRAAPEVPSTPEEVEETAKKYNLHPKEYIPYKNDGTGYGDYPKLPDIGAEARDPYYPWDMPTFKRNFNEAIHIEEDQLGEDRSSAGTPQMMTGAQGTAMFLGTMFILSTICMFFSKYPWFQPVMEKQYPKPGEIHYTFEPLR